jgi:hypothetical protein
MAAQQVIKRDWRALAWAAAATLDAAQPGGREAALAAAAQLASVRPQTLRTYVAAARFEATLGAALRAAARHMPPIALETAARWYARDPEGAAKAMLSYDEHYSVRTFAEAEFNARPPQDRAGRLAGRRKRDYRAQLIPRLEHLEELWPKLPSPDPRRYALLEDKDNSKNSDSAPFSDLMLRCENNGHKVAALIVGPYREPRIYRARAFDWILRILGLSFYHKQVALILPPAVKAEGEAKRYVGLLEAANRSPALETYHRVVLLRDGGPQD